MKKVLIVLAALLILGGASYVVLSRGNKDETKTPAPSEGAPQSQNAPQATSPQSGKITMNISNFAFASPNLTIKKGSTVTWTNQDSAQHTVTSDPDSANRSGLNSALLAKGASYSFKFTKNGTYKYHCTPHPYMTGTVEVVD